MGPLIDAAQDAGYPGELVSGREHQDPWGIQRSEGVLPVVSSGRMTASHPPVDGHPGDPDAVVVAPAPVYAPPPAYYPPPVYYRPPAYAPVQ